MRYLTGFKIIQEPGKIHYKKDKRLAAAVTNVAVETKIQKHEQGAIKQ